MKRDAHSLRLIIDKPASGPWNMSVDQALLDSVEATGAPVLRIYYWAPATLSLGYFQSAQDRQFHAESLSCPLVRRASGGGAILHDHEVTYSLCFPSASRWANKNTEIYTTVHACIIEVLRNWSIDAERVEEDVQSRSGKEPFLCFQRRASGDLLFDGNKIVGSAQRRSKLAVLQHGSILFERSEFAPQLPGVTDISGQKLDQNEFADSFAAAISKKMELSVLNSELELQELQLAERISRARFDTKDWNIDRRKS